MRVLIEINCGDIGQLLTHLNEISKEIKKEVKIKGLDMHRKEFVIDTQWDDCGSYGTHEFRVCPEPE